MTYVSWQRKKFSSLSFALRQGTAKDAAPQDLAWGHDVVLTTFSRLSAEWSGGDSGRASPLRQARLGPAPVTVTPSMPIGR